MIEAMEVGDQSEIGDRVLGRLRIGKADWETLCWIIGSGVARWRRFGSNVSRPCWLRLVPDELRAVFVAGHDLWLFDPLRMRFVMVLEGVMGSGMALHDRHAVGLRVLQGKTTILLPAQTASDVSCIRAFHILQTSIGPENPEVVAPQLWPFEDALRPLAGPIDTKNYLVFVYQLRTASHGRLVYRRKEIPGAGWLSLGQGDLTPFDLGKTVLAEADGVFGVSDRIRLYDSQNRAIAVDLETRKSTVLEGATLGSATREFKVDVIGGAKMEDRDWENITRTTIALISSSEEPRVVIPSAHVGLIYTERGCVEFADKGLKERKNYTKTAGVWRVQLFATSKFTVSFKVRCEGGRREGYMRFDLGLKLMERLVGPNPNIPDFELRAKSAVNTTSSPVFSNHDLGQIIGQDVRNACMVFWKARRYGEGDEVQPGDSGLLEVELNQLSVDMRLAEYGYEWAGTSWVSNLQIKT